MKKAARMFIDWADVLSRVWCVFLLLVGVISFVTLHFFCPSNMLSWAYMASLSFAASAVMWGIRRVGDAYGECSEALRNSTGVEKELRKTISALGHELAVTKKDLTAAQAALLRLESQTRKTRP